VSVLLVLEMPGANGTSLESVSVELDGASPRPSEDTRGSLQDLVMHGAGLRMPGSVGLGETIPAPGSSGTADLGVARLPLVGSPGFLLPPIDWRPLTP
jgi:hypothetical protein